MWIWSCKGGINFINFSFFVRRHNFFEYPYFISYFGFTSPKIVLLNQSLLYQYLLRYQIRRTLESRCPHAVLHYNFIIYLGDKHMIIDITIDTSSKIWRYWKKSVSVVWSYTKQIIEHLNSDLQVILLPFTNWKDNIG